MKRKAAISFLVVGLLAWATTFYAVTRTTFRNASAPGTAALAVGANSRATPLFKTELVAADSNSDSLYERFFPRLRPGQVQQSQQSAPDLPRLGEPIVWTVRGRRMPPGPQLNPAPEPDPVRTAELKRGQLYLIDSRPVPQIDFPPK